jgi:hypothetical protein
VGMDMNNDETIANSTYRNYEWLYHHYATLELTISEIASCCNAGNGTICRNINKMNIPKRTLSECARALHMNKYGITKSLLVEYYEKQMKPLEKIANIVGCNNRVIRYYMTKYGIRTRTLSESRMGKLNPNFGKSAIEIRGERNMNGKNNPNWRGGTSFEPYCEKWTTGLKERIRAFFEYRCIICGKHQNENKRKLCCHHVEYNKKACCDGKPVHFAALCDNHHAMTNGDRERWEYMIHYIIDEMYNGRSYYTKEEYSKLCAEDTI